MTTPSNKARVDDDDDDFDDLDDVLDKFTSAPPPKHPISTSSPPSASTSAKSPPSISSNSIPLPPPPPSTATISTSALHADSDAIDDLDSEFARELQKGMESLMRELGGVGLDSAAAETGDVGGAGGGKKTEQEKEQEQAFKAAWEAMLVEGMNGMVGDMSKPEAFSSSGSATTAAPTGAGAAKDNEKEGTGAEEKQDFQAGIRAAMEKLKSSESGLKDGTTPSSDPFSSFLSQIDAAGLGEGEEGNEEDIQGMLEMMMSSIMSKEVLYEPLKELGEKFPPYLSENATKLSAEDKTRYESQLDRINKILKIFEDPKYSDEDKDKSIELVELMGQMQSFGTPPTEVMGDLPPGFNLGADGMPQLPEGCCIS